MEIKYCTEKFIQDTGLDYTIIRLCGFMQVDWLIFLGLSFGQEFTFHSDALMLMLDCKSRCISLLNLLYIVHNS
jgi:hypothetical protein